MIRSLFPLRSLSLSSNYHLPVFFPDSWCRSVVLPEECTKPIPGAVHHTTGKNNCASGRLVPPGILCLSFAVSLLPPSHPPPEFKRASQEISALFLYNLKPESSVRSLVVTFDSFSQAVIAGTKTTKINYWHQHLLSSKYYVCMEIATGTEGTREAIPETLGTGSPAHYYRLMRSRLNEPKSTISSVQS